MNKKKRVFSGIQPSGSIHIGNYLGAIKNWVADQDKKDNTFCIVDLHAITVPQDPNELKKNITELAKIYIAAGLDPQKSVIFIQSDRPEHAELAWILNCFTYVGELNRMTQYKEKAGVRHDTLGLINEMKTAPLPNLAEINKTLKDMGPKISRDNLIKNFKQYVSETKKYQSLVEDNLTYIEELIRKDLSSVGLFDYPVLMAADILLYDTDEVPVGDDQKQHVELARDIAVRMNNRFNKIFVIPEPMIRKTGARIMALDNPKNKMAKSAGSEYNFIALRDEPDVVRKKIQKAVTDSGSEIIYNVSKKPALANLLTIYSLFADEKIEYIVKKYQGKGYADFKKELVEVIICGLAPIQDRLRELDEDPTFVAKVLAEGAEKAAPIAAATLARVKSKIGLG